MHVAHSTMYMTPPQFIFSGVSCCPMYEPLLLLLAVSVVSVGFCEIAQSRQRKASEATSSSSRSTTQGTDTGYRSSKQ